MGYELVGKVWDAEGFKSYLAGVNLTWADSVTVHHTAYPSLAQRPQGWKIQHLRNLAHYYKYQLGWSAAPHLFTDEDEIYGMSSLWRKGVHARSFNATSVGIEMLGNFDMEDPTTGRGLSVIETTAKLVAMLLTHMGLEVDEDTVHFHRDDPKTSKTCPGKLVDKDWFLSKVRDASGGTTLTLEQRIARIEQHLNIA